MSVRVAFLDRDGTLNVRPPEHRYVESPEQFAWLPTADDGAVALARAGFVLAVVSNQRGIARGQVSWETLASIEAEIQARLGARGARIEAFRYCPHDLDAHCDCRKPAPGMILELADALDADLAGSWMIGDAESDVAAGRAAGCRTALIALPETPPGGADLVGASLFEVAAAIVAEAAGPVSPPRA